MELEELKINVNHVILLVKLALMIILNVQIVIMENICSKTNVFQLAQYNIMENQIIHAKDVIQHACNVNKILII